MAQVKEFHIDRKKKIHFNPDVTVAKRKVRASYGEMFYPFKRHLTRPSS